MRGWGQICIKYLKCLMSIFDVFDSNIQVMFMSNIYGISSSQKLPAIVSLIGCIARQYNTSMFTVMINTCKFTIVHNVTE